MYHCDFDDDGYVCFFLFGNTRFTHVTWIQTDVRVGVFFLVLFYIVFLQNT